MALIDLIREKYGKAKKFIQQNPTPASFVNKKVVQPIVRSNMNTLDNLRAGVKPTIQATQNYFKPTTQVRARDIVREAANIPLNIVKNNNITNMMPSVNENKANIQIQQQVAKLPLKEKLKGVINPNLIKNKVNITPEQSQLAKSYQEKLGNLAMVVSAAPQNKAVKGADALSNEAKPDLYGIKQKLEREASDLHKKIAPAIESAKRDAKGAILPAEQKRLQAMTDAWGAKLDEIKAVNDKIFSPQSTQGATKKLKDTNVPLTPKNATEGVVGAPVGKTKPTINLDNLNISKTAKGRINKAIKEVKPQIEAKVGAKLTNQEAIDLADRTSKTLNNAAGRQQTLEWEAALLKTRQQLAKSAKSNTLDKDFINNLKNVKALATDTARKLQSFGIKADPLEATPKQAMVEAILKVETNTKKILDAAKGVDFNDAKQATEFYRKFIKPNASDWIDLLRYNSMLSSPLTHIKNISTNALQVGLVKPVEKTLSGVVDIFSKKPTNFVGEGAAYSGGVVKSIGDATQKFADVMSGKTGFTNQDLKYIPPSTGLGTKVLSFPTKMLEGMDQFFTTLATGGEQAALNLKKAKGVKIGNLKSAEDRAAYTVFRDKLGSNEQGYLLDGLDYLTGQIERARNADNQLIKQVAKFTLPFVKTPMNIFKQGLEYSPAGFLTTIGAKNVTEQVSKALIGSAVFGGAATLIGSGRLTWGEPINEKQRNEFRSAGMQPYSVKIGDKWIAYKYLGPLAFPLAMTAAIDYEQKQGRLDDTTTERIMGAVARYGEFLADQSYTKSMGDLLKAVGGGESSIAQLVSNYPQQLVPFRALGGWLARITDPYQRKISKDANFIEKETQLLMQNIPGLSQKLETRPDTFGNPIPNQNRVVNAFSPFSITTENPLGKDIYNTSEAKRAENRQIADLKKGNGGKTSTGKFVVKIGDEYQTFKSEQEKNLAVNKDEFKNSDKNFQIKDGLVYRKNKDGDVQPLESELSYNTKLATQKLENAKTSKNLKQWMELAKQQEQNLITQLQDPTLDELDKITLQQSLDKLYADADKYAGYGGFSKSKKSKKISLSLTRVVPKGRPTLRTISKPKINIKTISQGGNSGRVATTGQPRSIRVKRMA